MEVKILRELRHSSASSVFFLSGPWKSFLYATYIPWFVCGLEVGVWLTLPFGATAVSYTHLTLPTNREV